MNGAGSPDEVQLVPLSAKAREQIDDALALLEHVISTGFKPASEQALPADCVRSIKMAAAKVANADAPSTPGSPGVAGTTTPQLSAAQWLEFELAYHRLAQFTCPITAETLRNTVETGGALLTGRQAPALSFTRLLWLIALSFAAFVIVSEWGMVHYGPVQDGVVDAPNTFMQFVQILVPYGYGGLGSCVYLLKSGHRHLYERTFDLRRRPEYLNRIVLGTIAGGAIILFVDRLTDDDGNVVNLSAAALGFLAGYSTDFLYSAIERIVSAVLPKVGLTSVQRAAPARPATDINTSSTDLKDLMDRFERATTDESKALYRSLIERVRDRI